MKFIVTIVFALISSLAFAQQPVRIVCYPSITPKGPLFIINGKIMDDEKAENFIAPTDVEKIEVIKDAAAAAIYGSRGANGVILVTLKKGVKFLSYEQLLKKFKVNPSYSSYPLYFNHQPIANKAAFYASTNRIAAINLSFTDNGGGQIPYLNIVTKP
jgi:TonB-dependent SusC/RagA subfamily outer membrane receptor